jgi:hypothetical protein
MMKKNNQMNAGRLAVLVLVSGVLLVISSGCSSVYYATMEKFGVEKRHILVDDVKEVKTSQAKAQEEFKDALEKLRELYSFDGGDLETFYDNLKDSYEDCESRADQIEKRISSVRKVAKDLFREWESEISQMHDVKLKAGSRRSLRQSKIRYSKLEKAMEKSRKRMYPVLTKLRDYVLYLKHNLNAKAVGSLGGEVVSIEKEVAGLIKDMNASIKEADNFIRDF